MGKAKHKPTPQPPRWYWREVDGCWWCEYAISQKGCSNCKYLKAQRNEEREKRKRKVKNELKRFVEKRDVTS